MDRVHIPFSADMENRLIEKPDGAAWGWFYHFRFGKVEWLYCPICKHSAGILTRHTISDNGEVNASILCNTGKDCSWHIWGVLDDYQKNGGHSRSPLLA